MLKNTAQWVDKDGRVYTYVIKFGVVPVSIIVQDLREPGQPAQMESNKLLLPWLLLLLPVNLI